MILKKLRRNLLIFFRLFLLNWLNYQIIIRNIKIALDNLVGSVFPMVQEGQRFRNGTGMMGFAVFHQMGQIDSAIRVF